MYIEVDDIYMYRCCIICGYEQPLNHIGEEAIKIETSSLKADGFINYTEHEIRRYAV